MKRMREFEIERQFDLKIEEIKPNKGVYFVKTNKGKRCLKKIEYGVQKLYFVYGAKEYLINKGFDCVDKYYLNSEGEPYAIVNEDIYTLSEWIEGRECDFRIDEDIRQAARALAHFHINSKGYEPPENSKLKTDLGRWPNLMSKRSKSFDKMRAMAKKKSNKGKFELNYLKEVDYYKELSMAAMENLNNSKYAELCKEAEEDMVFCHHDYTCHNIIINDRVNVIDFDYCKREIRAYDIAGFMMKVLKRSKWNISYVKMILNAYSEVSQVTDDEIKVIYSFLLFPQRFWRLSNRFYYSELGKAQYGYNDKLLDIINEQKKYNKFLMEFVIEYGQNESLILDLCK